MVERTGADIRCCLVKRFAPRRPKRELTFRHPPEHPEDGAGPDERPGPKEVHGGRKVGPPKLILLVLHQDGVQPLLRVGQHHLAARLHGGFQPDEVFSLPGVRVAQARAPEAEEQTGHGHTGALLGRLHAPNADSWTTTMGVPGVLKKNQQQQQKNPVGGTENGCLRKHSRQIKLSTVELLHVSNIKQDICSINRF